MRLEEAIYQSKFKSEREKLAVNIIYTYNWLTARIKEIIEPHGVTIKQFNVLRILRGQFPKPATILLIKERMLDRMSDASRIVDRLLQLGLVERKTCENDRRAVDILITTKGLDLLAVLDEKTKAIDELSAPLDTEECRRLNDLLDRLRG